MLTQLQYGESISESESYAEFLGSLATFLKDAIKKMDVNHSQPVTKVVI